MYELIFAFQGNLQFGEKAVLLAICDIRRKTRVVKCRLDYNSLLKMKKISSPSAARDGSPGGLRGSLKEDAEDRLATRNSMQMTAEQEYLEERRSKRRKLHVVQHSQRLSRRLVSIPSLEEAAQTKSILPTSLNQNQRITFLKQSTNQTHPRVQIENRTKRNKIFSMSYLLKKGSLECGQEVEDQLEGESSTKWLSAKPESVQKERWVLQQIYSNPIQDFPTVAKDKNRNEKRHIFQTSNAVLSYPRFTTDIGEESITPGNGHSRIPRASIGKTEGLIFAAEDGQRHANPASKKIRPSKSKRKTPRCSFSKLSLERYQTGRRLLGSDSRASHCPLPECLIKDNLANYNIKVVESCSSEEEQGERYYDAEASPIRQKISYRNIDIQRSSAEEAQLEEEGHHNLFSDFEFPATPKRQQESKSFKEIIPKSNRKIVPLATPKKQIHTYLIGVALLLLIIQLIS